MFRVALDYVVPDARHTDHAEIGLAQPFLNFRALEQLLVDLFDIDLIGAAPTSVPILVLWRSTRLKARSYSGRERADTCRASSVRPSTRRCCPRNADRGFSHFRALLANRRDAD